MGWREKNEVQAMQLVEVKTLQEANDQPTPDQRYTPRGTPTLYLGLTQTNSNAALKQQAILITGSTNQP